MVSCDHGLQVVASGRRRSQDSVAAKLFSRPWVAGGRRRSQNSVATSYSRDHGSQAVAEGRRTVWRRAILATMGRRRSQKVAGQCGGELFSRPWVAGGRRRSQDSVAAKLFSRPWVAGGRRRSQDSVAAKLFSRPWVAGGRRRSQDSVAAKLFSRPWVAGGRRWSPDIVRDDNGFIFSATMGRRWLQLVAAVLNISATVHDHRS
jgi:hypothetical protein